MCKAILFDFDYTLGDSSKGIILSIQYALEKLGYPTANEEEIKRTIGLSLKETFFSLTTSRNEKEAETFAHLFKEKADEVMVFGTQLYAGVKDVLQNLMGRGYKTGIVTTKFHYRIEQILHKFDANNLVDIIVGAEDVKVEKPSPEGLLWAIEQLRVTKEDVLYVGDSVVDAKTAENAGVSFAAVLTGTTKREEFEEYSTVCIGESIVSILSCIIV